MELLVHAMLWMNPKSIMQSEKSDTQKTTLSHCIYMNCLEKVDLERQKDQGSLRLEVTIRNDCKWALGIFMA